MLINPRAVLLIPIANVAFPLYLIVLVLLGIGAVILGLVFVLWSRVRGRSDAADT